MSQSLNSCMAARTSCVMWWLCKKTMLWYIVRIKHVKTCYIAWTSCSQRQGSTVSKASIQRQKKLKEPTRHETSTMNINCLDITMQCEIWLWVSCLNFYCGRMVSWLSISLSTTFDAICVFPWKCFSKLYSRYRICVYVFNLSSNSGLGEWSGCVANVDVRNTEKCEPKSR